MILYFAGILIAFAKQDGKVTLILPAAPASAFVPQLGKRLGMPLRISAGMSKEVLIARVQDVPAQELLARIANACGGEWRTGSDGAKTLFKSETLRRARTAAIRREEADNFRSQVQILRKEMAAYPEFTSEKARRLAQATVEYKNATDRQAQNKLSWEAKQLSLASPGRRLCSDVLGLLSPEDVVRERGPKITYSNLPVGRQHPLRGGVEPFVERFVRDDGILIAEAERVRSARGIDQDRGDTNFDPGVLLPGDPQSGLGKVVLRLEHVSPTKAWYAELTVTDSVGRSLGQSSALLTRLPATPAPVTLPHDPVLPAGAFALDLEKATRGELRQEPVMNLTAVRNRAVQIITVGEDPPSRAAAPSKAFLAVVADPVKYEPLQLAIGDLLISGAEADSFNLVGDLSDGTFGQACLLRTHPGPLSRILNDEGFRRAQEASFKEGWLTLTPLDFETCTRNRTDRLALATLAGALVRNKVLSLEDLAEFSQTQEVPLTWADLGGQYLFSLNPRVDYNSADWYVYRLLGSLAPEMLANVARGRPFLMASVNQRGREAIWSYLDDITPAPKLSPARTEQELRNLPLLSDWDELLPDGLEERGVIQVEAKTEPVAIACASATEEALMKTAAEIAGSQFSHQEPTLKAKAIGVTFDRFAPGVRLALHLTFLVKPGVSFDTDLMTGRVDDGAGFGPLSEMPDTFQAVFQKEYALDSQFFKGATLTDPNRRKAPPPP